MSEPHWGPGFIEACFGARVEPTTDNLVERLRACPCASIRPPPIEIEAADRIEQLEAELAKAKRGLVRAGFEDKGGQEWKPPIGSRLDRDGRMSSELRDWITGMSVSLDVSTGDHDWNHRYFGVVSEVMDDHADKHGVTLLVYDAKPNFIVGEVK